MDKYEFSIKAEQIKKLSSQGDYKTAMQIADTIDWNRVRNANLLSSIADIYEYNGEYEEAKDILLMAFERAPVGKRFLYKLSELSLRSGSIEEAIEFYKEFLDVSPEDPRKYLLRYKILKAKGAMASQLVGPLEQFTETELDEKWLYELAKLYGEAGREEDCIALCDKMILLFGMGKYVDKAQDLKLRYRPFEEDTRRAPRKESFALPEEEPAFKEKNSGQAVYEEKPPVREVSEEASRVLAPKEVSREEIQREKEKQAESNALSPAEEVKSEQEKALETEAFSKKETEEASDKASREESKEASEEFSEESSGEKAEGKEVAKVDAPAATDEKEEPIPTYHMIIEADTLEEGFKIAVEEIKYFHQEYNLEFKVAKTNADKLNEKGFAPFAEKLKERDLIIEEAGKLKYSVVDEIERYIQNPKDASSIILVDVYDHFDRMAEDRPRFIDYFDIVSNKEEPEEEEDSDLEDVDLEASVAEPEKEEAEETVEEEYVPHKPSIFDRPARPYTEVLEEEARKEEEAKEKQEAPSEVREEAPARDFEDAEPEEEYYDDENEDYDEEIEEEAVEDAPSVREERREAPIREEEEDLSAISDALEKHSPLGQREKKNAGMSIDEFAEYAISYADSIDCAITEKGITALYERIQLMEEDGILLNKKSAEDLVEEAADQAEKPSLGKKLSSFLRPKYNKDDKLILREEHFMG
nr:tetratricopeptide repeat protein [uncultured Oribacterium sp.]